MCQEKTSEKVEGTEGTQHWNSEGTPPNIWAWGLIPTRAEEWPWQSGQLAAQQNAGI